MSFNTFVTTALILLTNLTPLYFTVQYEWSFLQVYVFYLIETAIVVAFNFRKEYLMDHPGSNTSALLVQFVFYSYLIAMGVLFFAEGGNLLKSAHENLLIFAGYSVFILVSQYLTYKINFLGRKEYLVTTLKKIHSDSFRRVFVFLLLGGVVAAWGNLTMLIVFKTFFDTLLYLRTRTDSWKPRIDWI